jgi:hypothetical protein
VALNSGDAAQVLDQHEQMRGIRGRCREPEPDEWLNTQVRQSWSCTEAMPRLPPFGTGFTPFLQWLIVPAIAFGYVRRKAGISGVISP